MRRPAALTEPQQQERYLAMIAKRGTLRAGCAAAKCSAHTVYKWREHDTVFAVREQEARDSFADRLEELALQRAHDGSDRMIEMLLRALRPEKYRDRHEVSGPGGGPLQHEHSGSIEHRGMVEVRAVDYRSAAAALRPALAQPEHAN